MQQQTLYVSNIDLERKKPGSFSGICFSLPSSIYDPPACGLSLGLQLPLQTHQPVVPPWVYICHYKPTSLRSLRGGAHLPATVRPCDLAGVLREVHQLVEHHLGANQGVDEVGVS